MTSTLPPPCPQQVQLRDESPVLGWGELCSLTSGCRPVTVTDGAGSPAVLPPHWVTSSCLAESLSQPWPAGRLLQVPSNTITRPGWSRGTQREEPVPGHRGLGCAEVFLLVPSSCPSVPTACPGPSTGLALHGCLGTPPGRAPVLPGPSAPTRQLVLEGGGAHLGLMGARVPGWSQALVLFWLLASLGGASGGGGSSPSRNHWMSRSASNMSSENRQDREKGSFSRAKTGLSTDVNSTLGPNIDPGAGTEIGGRSCLRCHPDLGPGVLEPLGRDSELPTWY